MSISRRIFEALPSLATAIAVLGVAFGVFAYFVDVNVKTSAAWVVVAAIGPLVVCVMLVDMLRRAISESRSRPPRIVLYLATQGPQSLHLLLIGSSPLFGQGMSASIYLMEEGFEILIGEGYVLTVQHDQHIQIAVTRLVDGTDAMGRQLASNSPDALRRTIVRPGHQARGM